MSPVGISRRGSNARGSIERRFVDQGSFRNSRSPSRRESVERGARIAETGTLIPRSRGDNRSVAEESVAGEGTAESR